MRPCLLEVGADLLRLRASRDKQLIGLLAGCGRQLVRLGPGVGEQLVGIAAATSSSRATREPSARVTGAASGAHRVIVDAHVPP